MRGIGVYRGDQLTDIPVAFRVRKLFGWMGGVQRDELLAVRVRLSLLDTPFTPWYCTQFVSDGRWDEWIVFGGLSIADCMAEMRLELMVGSGCKEGKFTASWGIADEDGIMRHGLYRVPLGGENCGEHEYSEQARRFDRFLKRYEHGRERIGWLDEASFAVISRLQLEEAESSKQLYLIVEFPQYDSFVSLKPDPSDPDPNAILAVDAMLKPTRVVQSNELQGKVKLRPSTRSLAILKRLFCDTPAIRAIGANEATALWKYREWVAEQPGGRAMLLFARSVNRMDREELSIAKGLLQSWQSRTQDKLPILLSLLALCCHSPELACFDEELAGMIAHYDEIDGLALHAISIAVHSIDDTAFPLVLRHLKRLIRDGAAASLKSAETVYWLARDHVVDSFAEIIDSQQTLIAKLEGIIDGIRELRQPRLQKLARLCQELEDPGHGLLTLLPGPLPLPTDAAGCRVSGVIVDRSMVYKSTAMPVKIAFLGADDCAEHSVIIKTAEGVEADLMVQKCIQLIDGLWRGKGLDLCLVTYSVLPTRPQHGGWLEFVPSASLSAILADYSGSLLPYLASLNQPENAADNYLRSCAGYSVLTYVLGVGDRHLENLLLTDDGRLFHVDYAYLFGADPKPLPPPMKLCREMVEAMGGQSSLQYRKFKELVLRAFQVLRKSAHLLLDFLGLHCRLVKAEQVMFVRDRLALDLEDADALKQMDQLINDSVTALFPQVMETIHKWAQYWRR